MAAALPILGKITFGTILKTVAFGAAGHLIGSALNKNKTPAATAPVAATPAVMPTPDDEAIRLARKRSITQQLSRGGRQSTLLTQAPAGQKLGG